MLQKKTPASLQGLTNQKKKTKLNYTSKALKAV